MPIRSDTIKKRWQIDAAYNLAIKTAVSRTGELVRGEAVRRAPIDTSALRQSGDTTETYSVADVTTVGIYFDLPYARRQHEENYNHPKGGEQYYLKNALEMNKITLLSEIKKQLAVIKL